MIKNSFFKSVATKVSVITLAIILISTAAVGIFSYVIYKSVAAQSHAERALAIAESVAYGIDTDNYNEIFSTMEKDEYWYSLYNQICKIKEHTDVDYLYILDRNYGDTVVSFAEGDKTTDTTDEELGLDLGEEESSDAYADEMFEALRTAEPQITSLYYAEGYGMMVGGFCPVVDSSGKAIAVVGVEVMADAVIEDANAFGLKLILIVFLVTVATVWIPIVFVRTRVGRPLKELCAVSDRLAVGDLRANPPEINSQDEVGELAESFKNMLESTRKQVVALKQLADGDLSISHQQRCENDDMSLSMIHLTKNLNEMLGEINQSASHVSQGARQMSENSQHLAQSANDQTMSVSLITETTASLYEKTRENTEKAKAAARVTQEIKETAQTGSEQMEQMIVAVNEINEANKSIETVMKAVDDIAFQTNILALNAAVEAARAGQYGKGFAVVAGEVRTLAAKSADAAKETAVLVSNSIEKARMGSSIANETAESLNRIAAGVNDSTSLVSQIAEASLSQTEDIGNLKKGIEQMSSVVHQNSSTAQESAAACEEMSGQSELLSNLVMRFKLK